MYHAIAKDSRPSAHHQIATVTHVDAGQAQALVFRNGYQITQPQHTSMTPELSVNDRVIVVAVESEWIILDRLRAEDEQPFLSISTQQLSLSHEHHLHIKAADSEINLQNDGSMSFSAKIIQSTAKKLNEIKGKLITLN